MKARREFSRVAIRRRAGWCDPARFGNRDDAQNAPRRVPRIFRLRRRLLLRREAAVEGLALGRPCRSAACGGVKRGPYLASSLSAQLDEVLGAHAVDVGQRAAGERREAEAEDRADIGLAQVGDDALLDSARGFQRLHHQEALLQLLDVERIGIELLRLQVREARPQALLARSCRDSRRSPCRSCGRSGPASRPLSTSSVFCAWIDRRRRRDRPRSPS